MTDVNAMPFSHRWSVALSMEARLTPTDIAVARALALHMNGEGGSCYPTHAKVAFETHLQEVTVRRSIRHLRTLGWLRQTARSAPGRAAAYEAMIPDVPEEHRYRQTTDGREHRSPRTGEHRYPETAIRQHRYPETGEHRYPGTKTPAPGDRPGIHQVSIERASTAASPFDADFDACWSLYPRKVARKAALAAYIARRRAGISHDELLTATGRYADRARGTDPRFVLHGSTFFGPAERWRDYLPGAEVSFDTPEMFYDAPEVMYR